MEYKELDKIELFLENPVKKSFDEVFAIKQDFLLKNVVIDFFTFSDFFENDDNLNSEPSFSVRLLRLKKITKILKYFSVNSIEFDLNKLDGNESNYIKTNESVIYDNLTRNNQIKILMDYFDNYIDIISDEDIKKFSNNLSDLNNYEKYFVFFSTLFI